MDINFLNEYAVPVIVGICLCLGYILKTSVPIVKNNHIPLIISTVGILINIWLNKDITPYILLGGMFSGLASTGLYELFRNTFINKGE